MGGFSPFALEMAAQLSRHAAVAVASALVHERSVNFFTHTCEMLVSFLEGMDVHYPGHSRVVAALADMVTRKLGLSETDRRNVHFAALLHDIGKVMVDATVLRHRGLLSAEAQARLAEHPARASPCGRSPFGRASCPPSSRTTSDGTERAIRAASRATRSPWAAASSRWPTPSTP